MNRGLCAIAAVALAVGLTGTACGKSDTGSTATSTSSAAPVAADQLPGLVPTPANTGDKKGPDSIGDNGIHLHFEVNSPPSDAMAAFKSALTDKGWAVTTIVTSGGPGGGGATYTGTNGAAYGVFDGGGFNTTTFINVCVWPSKPADPNCTRS
ncbi:hypothetical protein FHT40_005643 [Mycolicibacterium sp. BK556]|uniref:hypothetical protein n=1 Tax=Mycobacteriaceae TaxID=1762 RepID=UPI00105C2586|nr:MULTISPECIES: hypothetical protein [Mycobacteriaceae]MBB3605954.1 hypothetical protein [Mycolicibacterium sp. BK556]MBB3632531.1 hypothetical protein [Mycolicibacterium sp. BK607]MBB3753927.1 hypothetical protein [Mycolicibacterium sp. BK634]TDO18096.1 hypothetical protein EV580_1277 [Mycobacterium sp. BK086]